MVSLKGLLPNKHDVALAAGAAVSGTVTGYVQQLLPINLEFFPGMTEFLIGVGLKKFLLKKGLGASFAKGIAICGLSNMIASFVPQFAGTFPTTKRARAAPDGAIHAPVGRYPRRGIYLQRSPGFESMDIEKSFAPHGTPTRMRRVQRGIPAV